MAISRPREAILQQIIGIVTRSDLLKPRAREVEEEIKRERVIGVRPVVAADDAED